MRLIVRLLEILFWVVIVVWVLRLLFGRLLRVYFGSTRSRTNAPPPAPPARGGETFRDPVCGTYVSPEVSVSALFQGQRVHFCSEECMERYRSRSPADHAARNAAGR